MSSPRIVLPICIMLIAMLYSAASFAHPLGNYSINQYFLVDLRESPPVIYYLIDMAEIPSFTELDLLDTDFDSEITDEERATYMKLKVPPLLANLSLRQGDAERKLKPIDQQLSLMAGSGGMVVFNIVLKLSPEEWTAPSGDSPFEFEIISTNYPKEQGVRECMLVLDKHYRDDTFDLGEDRLQYQTLVFLDENENPVYQDFDGQFLLRLGESQDEPITGEKATEIAFQWTSTAKAAKSAGETGFLRSFGAKPEGETAPSPSGSTE